MKNMVSVIIITIAVISLPACKKQGGISDRQSNSGITGRWRFTAFFYSTGAPGRWYPAETDGQWINFDRTGDFSSNLSPFSGANHYLITDSSHINLTIAPGRDSLFYFFALDTLTNTLQLSPARPSVCIEGCAQRFSR